MGEKEKHEKAVADFLSEQLVRKEKERNTRDEWKISTYRANLGFLLNTWRFILVTRAAFFALVAAALQYMLQNIGLFLNTTRLITVMEDFFGRETVLIKTIRLLTVSQAARLVAMLIVAIVSVSILIDATLALLQRRCLTRGFDAERYLSIEGIFHEVLLRKIWVELPFWVARMTIIAFAIIALVSLGIS